MIIEPKPSRALKLGAPKRHLPGEKSCGTVSTYQLSNRRYRAWLFAAALEQPLTIMYAGLTGSIKCICFLLVPSLLACACKRAGVFYW